MICRLFRSLSKLLLSCFTSTSAWQNDRQEENGQIVDPRTNALRQMAPYRLWKRAHNIEARALNQFKNCYFSPIQCVLMERRRR
ncbi:hypothetical protein Q1695_006900 [Nippostrongylus brasiliensis]|nr:hypothetical protein Q1695_006900 [Nippostrongylus brasiliensis]